MAARSASHCQSGIPRNSVLHQALREFGFDLVSLEVVVQFGDFAERFGREQPDFSGVRVADANEDDGNIAHRRWKRCRWFAGRERRMSGLPSGRVLSRRRLPTKARSISTFNFSASVRRLATGGGRRSSAGNRRRPCSFRPARPAETRARFRKACRVRESRRTRRALGVCAGLQQAGHRLGPQRRCERTENDDK